MPDAAKIDAVSPMDRVSGEKDEEPPTQEAHTKVKLILAACENGQADSLVALASSAGGLVDDEVRRVACTSKKKQVSQSC